MVRPDMKYFWKKGYEHAMGTTAIMTMAMRTVSAGTLLASPVMRSIAALREKYDLHMRVERYAPLEEEEGGEAFIRK